jgi:hypothetical protein
MTCFELKEFCNLEDFRLPQDFENRYFTLFFDIVCKQKVKDFIFKI